MILVQKAPSESPLYAHGRLPTRTPGLLTLSKPSRPRRTLPKSTMVRASLPNLPAETRDSKKSGVIALPATPQRPGSGQVKNTKNKVQKQRSNSPSPSPPSRKSANHKQHPPSSLVSSEAIPVPVAPRRQSPNISRSVPLPSQIHRRPHPISARPSTFHNFPICDDMNDVADLCASTTPPPTRRDHVNNIQTAPISSRTPGPFPFDTMGPPSSPSLRRKRKHRKTPSEGVFHMSSDEGLSSGSDGTNLNMNVQTLFGLVNTFKPSSKMLPSAFSTPIRTIPPFKTNSAHPSYGSLQSKCGTSEKAAGYFASSMFQNSPNPEELPDPPIF